MPKTITLTSGHVFRREALLGVGPVESDGNGGFSLNIFLMNGVFPIRRKVASDVSTRLQQQARDALDATRTEVLALLSDEETVTDPLPPTDTPAPAPAPAPEA